MGLVDPTTQLVTLTNGLFDVVHDATHADGVPLELKTGSVKIELVVDGDGKLEVAAAGFWKKVLELIGIEGKASVTAEWVSTSSITLNFTNPGDQAS